MKNQLVYVEDEQMIADGTMNWLSLDDIVESRLIINDYDEFMVKVTDFENHRRAYLIDLKLNPYAGFKGLDLIDYLAANDPKALIIVYSAFQGTPEKLSSLKRGAATFVSKTAGDEERTNQCLMIRNLLKVYYHNEEWEKETIIEGIVSDVSDEDFVTVACLISQGKKPLWIERLFPKNPFSKFKSMGINFPLKIVIRENPGVIITELEENLDGVQFDNYKNKTRDEEIENSPIFKP